MMQALYPTYSISLVIKDGVPSRTGTQGPIANSQTTSQIAGHVMGTALTAQSPFGGYKYQRDGKTGCDDVVAAVKDALSKAGIDADVRLTRFEHS